MPLKVVVINEAINVKHLIQWPAYSLHAITSTVVKDISIIVGSVFL